MQNKLFAPTDAATLIKIIKITKLENKQPVYNMEVENVHNFSINGGLIVHNCLDSLRYAFNEEIIAERATKFGISKNPINRKQRRSAIYD